jgi:hypothetical protein
MKRKLLNLLVLLLLCQANSLLAQKYISPYSRFGIGDMASSQFIRHRGMSSSLAIGSENRMNLNNPASWGHLSSYNLESGITTDFYRLRTSATDYKNYDFFPAYISLAVPLKRDTHNIWLDSPRVTRHNWGLSAGLIPYSRLSYQTRNIRTDSNDAAFGASEYNIGEGGLSKFYAGVAGEVFNNCFIGVSGSYIFGRNRYSHLLVFPDAENKADLVETNSYVVGGFAADLGILAGMRVGKRHREYNRIRLNDTLRLALTISPAINLNVRQDMEVYTKLDNREDSLVNVSQARGDLHLPTAIGAGLSYTLNTNKTFAFDASYRRWSEYSLLGNNPGLRDQLVFSLGSEWNFEPDSADRNLTYERYIHRMKFRAGAKYGMMHYPGERVTDMGFSAGVGLPVRTFRGATESQSSFIDFAVEAGRVGKAGENTVQHDYLMISLGLHLFDYKWFNRARIE